MLKGRESGGWIEFPRSSHQPGIRAERVERLCDSLHEGSQRAGFDALRVRRGQARALLCWLPLE